MRRSYVDETVKVYECLELLLASRLLCFSNSFLTSLRYYLPLSIPHFDHACVCCARALLLSTVALLTLSILISVSPLEALSKFGGVHSIAGLQKTFPMAQAATATAPGALNAFSSSIVDNVSLKTSSVNVASWKSQPKRSLAVRASGESENAQVGYANRSETGIVFEPFAEVQSQLVQVPAAYSESLARQRFSPSCEAAINDQINVEYNVSYVYHALFSYFDRDNVALPGFAKFFKENSEEEREHAEKLMKYQNKRGGRVKLSTITSPVMEFDHAEKGDALYSMELALSLEKLVNEKLLSLHQVAVDNNDPEMSDFVEREYLQEQVEAIKKFSGYVSQLRRVGKGHGVYHFDLQLQE